MALETEHIAFELLADIAEGRIEHALQAECLAHLAGCGKCRAQLRRLEHVVSLMRSDERSEPDQAVVKRALRLFRFPAPAPGKGLRHLLARLRLDSFQQPLAFGTRSAHTGVRELIYSADERELDVHLTAASDGWTLSGQLLGGRHVAGQVVLRGAQGELRAELGPLSEFTLAPVPAGVYALHLLLADLEIEVRELVVGA